jgi:hypothetical protein
MATIKKRIHGSGMSETQSLKDRRIEDPFRGYGIGRGSIPGPTGSSQSTGW